MPSTVSLLLIWPFEKLISMSSAHESQTGGKTFSDSLRGAARIDYCGRNPVQVCLPALKPYFKLTHRRTIVSEIEQIRAGRWDAEITAKITGVPIPNPEPAINPEVRLRCFHRPQILIHDP